MADTEPVKFGDLRPGRLVPQAPKRITETLWTEGGVVLSFDDGTTQVGGFDDAIYVVKKDDAAPAPAEKAGA